MFTNNNYVLKFASICAPWPLNTVSAYILLFNYLKDAAAVSCKGLLRLIHVAYGVLFI